MRLCVCTGGHSLDSNPDKYDISNPNPAPDLVWSRHPGQQETDGETWSVNFVSNRSF